MEGRYTIALRLVAYAQNDARWHHPRNIGRGQCRGKCILHHSVRGVQCKLSICGPAIVMVPLAILVSVATEVPPSSLTASNAMVGWGLAVPATLRRGVLVCDRFLYASRDLRQAE